MRYRRLLLLSLPFVVVSIAWSIWLRDSFSIPFWQTRSDYTELSFAQAVKTDLWLAHAPDGQRGYFQVMHPGIPFQVASWCAYRTSLIGETAPTDGPLERFRITLDNTRPFWRWNRNLAVIITAVSILVACISLYAMTQSYWAIAAILSFYSYWLSLEYSSFLGNEVFALPLGVAAAWTAFLSLGKDARWWHPLAFGVIGACGYLNKLNYIAYFPAFFAGTLLLLLLRAKTFKATLLSCSLAGFGFAAGMLVIGAGWLGWAGFRLMFTHHLAVLNHTGIYEGGASGVIDGATFIGAAKTLWTSDRQYLSFALVVILLAGLAAVFKKDRPAQATAWLAYLMLTALLCAVATFKHFSGHYFISTCVPLMFLTGYVLAHFHWSVRGVLIAACIFLVVVSGQKTISEHRFKALAAAEDVSLVRDTLKLPLGPDEIRIWSYRVGSPQYLSSFVAAMIDSPRTSQIVFDKYPRERTTAPWYNWGAYDTKVVTPLEKVTWRYAIIDGVCWYVPADQKFPRNPENGNGRIVISSPRIVVVENLAVRAPSEAPAK